MVLQRWAPSKAMAAWRPFRELEGIEQRFDDLFGRSGEWTPAIDVFEKDDKFVIKAELPGMKEEDIDVSVTDSTLTIRGEKTTETSFIDVDVWGAVAENCGRYLRKGSRVVVLGRLKQDRWEAEDGAKRSRLKVLASSVQFLSSAAREQSGPSGPSGQERDEFAAAEAGQDASAEPAWEE